MSGNCPAVFERIADSRGVAGVGEIYLWKAARGREYVQEGDGNNVDRVILAVKRQALLPVGRVGVDGSIRV